MRKTAKIASLGLFIFSVLFVIAFVFYQQKIHTTPEIILPNIYLDHLSVGNLTREKARTMLKKRYQQSLNFRINLYLGNKTIASLTPTQIEYQIPIRSGVDQAYSVGRGPGLASLYQQVSLYFGWENYNFDLNPIYNEKYIQDLLGELDSAYKKDPVNARFDFQDNRVQVFKVNKDGYQLNTQLASQQIREALDQQRSKPQPEINIKLVKEKLEAKIRLKDINNLGITQLVAEGSSHFAGSSPERVHNVVTGANKLNGQIIKPGQTFSFNEFLGEISMRTGFAQAYVIKNGRTVLDDGGGICQVSTTMFRTALNAGLPILKRTAHAYRVGYYEQDAKPGLDATIYLPSVDLEFKNDYQSALLIQTNLDLNEMKLTFSLYGTPDNRQVDLSEIEVWNVAPPPPPEYIDDFSLPEGVTKQVDFSAPGATSKFGYKVTYPTGEIKEQEFVSNYRPWKAIFLVGKKTN